MSAWIQLIIALMPFDPPATVTVSPLPNVALDATPLSPIVASASAGYCGITAIGDPILPFARPVEAAGQTTLAVASALSRATITLTDAPTTGYAVPAIQMLPDSYGLGIRRPAIELQRADDGLFYVTGVVNGQPIRFLVDTGASTITLTAADATRVGAVSTGEAPWVANTANGRRSMRRVRLGKMVVGTTNAADVPAAVAPDGLGVSLLGANWLTHISSMMIEGDRMVIR